MDGVSFVLYSNILLFLVGLYTLSYSPSIIKLDKNKNRCTKENKHIWQKKYKVEILCKLSDVKEAVHVVGIGAAHLCLKVKSGKNIILQSRQKGREDFYDT